MPAPHCRGATEKPVPVTGAPCQHRKWAEDHGTWGSLTGGAPSRNIRSVNGLNMSPLPLSKSPGPPLLLRLTDPLRAWPAPSGPVSCLPSASGHSGCGPLSPHPRRALCSPPPAPTSVLCARVIRSDPNLLLLPSLTPGPSALGSRRSERDSQLERPRGFLGRFDA